MTKQTVDDHEPMVKELGYPALPHEALDKKHYQAMIIRLDNMHILVTASISTWTK